MKNKIIIITFLVFSVFMVSIQNVYARESIVDNSGGGYQVSESTDSEDVSCQSLFGRPTDRNAPAYYIVLAFDIIKYIAIIILVVMAVLDFVNAIASGKDDAINTAVKKVMVRFVICVIIFILPILLKFGLSLIDERAAHMCGIGGVE